MECLMPRINDLSRSFVAIEQDSTAIAVIEMGLSGWRVADIVPGIHRHPLKKIAPDPELVLQLLRRGNRKQTIVEPITRVSVAYEAGRDGFWLACWPRARDIDLIDPSSVPVSREHRRATTNRLDTELLKRAFLVWLHGEPDRTA
jgi:transposase